MTQDGRDGIQPPCFERPGEFVQAVLANEPAAGPGAVADEVDAPRGRGNGEFGQLQAQPLAQEAADALQVLLGLIARLVEKDEVIHIPAIHAHTQLTLDELVQRVQVDQRVQLA